MSKMFSILSPKLADERCGDGQNKNFKKASKKNDSWVPRIILCALLCSIPKTENCCHLFWLSSMAVQSTLICERLHQFQF